DRVVFSGVVEAVAGEQLGTSDPAEAAGLVGEAVSSGGLAVLDEVWHPQQAAGPACCRPRPRTSGGTAWPSATTWTCQRPSSPRRGGRRGGPRRSAQAPPRPRPPRRTEATPRSRTARFDRLVFSRRRAAM